MTVVDALLAGLPGATTESGFPPVTVEIPLASWASAVAGAKEAGATFFDFLSAVDEPDGIRVVCHLVRPEPFEQLVLRTVLDGSASVASVASLFGGAGWHERETAEMFGVTFLDGAGAPLALEPLLLPPGFVDHPLRKDYALRSRVETAWPGDNEPT